jgi:hypothetical protein
VSIPTKRLVAFDCTPESFRILQFWTSEETPCISQQLLTLASLLLHRTSSKRLFYSFHAIVYHVVYLCPKFGALNPTKLGVVGTSFNQSIRYRLADSLFQRFSGFLTYSLCFLGHQSPIHGPSWTVVYKSPLTHVQVDFEAMFEPWSRLKLRLKMDNFIEEYVSLILLLSTIFTAAVGRIITKVK